MTCWRCLRAWQQAGVWRRLHRMLLQRLPDAGEIDWSRASVDAAWVPAKRGGAGTGLNPVDRGKPGMHHHLIVDCRGITPRIARPTRDSRQRLGRYRWRHRNRRLLVSDERHPDRHDAFLDLGCALIGWRFIERHRLW